MDYGFVHENKVFTPNGTIGVSPEENAARNEAIQAAELARWATCPDVQLAYYHFPNNENGPHSFRPTPHFPYRCDICGGERGLSPELCERSRQYRASFYPSYRGAYVTLWLGARIGTITSAKVYRHNFGGRFVALTVQGSNGARYHGRASWDNGTCISLRKGKS